MKHDVPENAIVADNLAEIIRYQHSKETFDTLCKTHWWDKEFDYLMKFYNYIDDIEAF